jgi:hypothetical protein
VEEKEILLILRGFGGEGEAWSNTRLRTPGLAGCTLLKGANTVDLLGLFLHGPGRWIFCCLPHGHFTSRTLYVRECGFNLLPCGRFIV